MKTMDKPTVVHVVNTLEGGGTERALLSLVNAFDHQLLRHMIVPLRQAGCLSALLSDRVSCRPLHTKGRSPVASVRLARIVRRLEQFPKSCDAPERTNRQQPAHQPRRKMPAREIVGTTRLSRHRTKRGSVQKATIIHARNTGCWGDSTLAHMLCPETHLILGFHGLETAAPFSRRQKLKAILALRCGARFTTVSRSGMLQLSKQVGIPPNRIDVLPNGVDTDSFKPPSSAQRESTRAAMQFTDADLVVGTVGHLTPVKDHQLLLRAFAGVANQTKRWKLLVVGEGPLHEQLLQQAHKLGIHQLVRFTGRREDVPRLLGCMDLYVCSSRSEGMSNAVLEAMATGLPIIATNAGDNATLLRNGVDGAIIPTGDTDRLTKTLHVLSRSPETRRRFAHSARTRAGTFDFGETVRAYETHYRTILEGGRHTARGRGPERPDQASRNPLQESPTADDNQLADPGQSSHAPDPEVSVSRV